MKTATSKLSVAGAKVALFALALAVSAPAEAGVRYLREGDSGLEVGGSLLAQAIEWVTVVVSGVLGTVIP